MIWLILLCPNTIKVETKREQVLRIWSWSGHELSPDSPWLTRQVLAGVGNAGQGFNYNRWRELVFLIRCVISFKKLSKAGSGQAAERSMGVRRVDYRAARR